ncbi:MAG: polysaccharide deacetylase family protein [Rhodospirillaceae bacterium]
MTKKALLAGCLTLLAGFAAPAVEAASSAVVLMYHRFGESEYPATNTTVEQLEQHIAELTSGAYTVLGLDEIVGRLLAGQDLPDRTVGISIDDSYRSIHEIAWPRLKAAGLPFTVFIATSHLNQGSPKHLSWDQVREMQAAGVGFGHHTVSHLHMPRADAARLNREIADAHARFEAELGFRPKLFAYPYGEAGLRDVGLVKDAGFAAAFGQHSGVIGSTGDMFYLPRFAMNETYGDLARLRLAINALPLTVTDVTPPDHALIGANPPSMGFTVKGRMGDLQRLSCFLSHAGRAEVQNLDPRIEVRTDKAFPKGRTRLNCTMPVADGRWRWYGRQFIVP